MKARLLLAIPLLFPLVIPQRLKAETILGVPQDTIQTFLVSKPPAVFPDMRVNYQKTVVEPREAKAAADKAAAEKAALEAAQAVRYTAPVSYTTYVYTTSTGTLNGSIGYSMAGGNCVNEPGINNPHDGTNPISWVVLSNSPWIGATVLFPYNHAAVITGIWSNGDIEVRHQNAGGAPHRYPRSQIRGFR